MLKFLSNDATNVPITHCNPVCNGSGPGSAGEEGDGRDSPSHRAPDLPAGAAPSSPPSPKEKTLHVTDSESLARESKREICSRNHPDNLERKTAPGSPNW